MKCNAKFTGVVIRILVETRATFRKYDVTNKLCRHNLNCGYSQNNTANNEENEDLSCATCARIAYSCRCTS